jgi:hypothetical protein
MKKRITCFLAMVLLTNWVVAQSYCPRTSTDYKNFKKYWWYHYRLLNDFMAKGDCVGCSEAMNERDRRDLGETAPTGKAKWGDQTISLGMYMGVLATEYRLLKNANQPVDTTLQELYFALKAFNRLDETAEEYFNSYNANPSSPSDLNGYFIRDDIDEHFLDHHQRLKDGVTSSYPVFNTESDHNASDRRTNEVSHDQIWHLFMGLALVSTLVNDGVTYKNLELNDLDHNADIAQEAKNIAGRLTDYMMSHDWRLKNQSGAPVWRGEDVRPFSYGAAEAACFIKDENVTPSWWYPIHSCEEYHDPATTAGFLTMADADLWNDFGKGIGSLLAISDEDYKIQVLAAIGHSWWNKTQPFFPDPYWVTSTLFNPYNLLHPFQTITTLVSVLTPLPPVNMTTVELGTRAIARDWQHLPILHQLLHGGGNLVSSCSYYNLLDDAPCGGPFNFEYPSNSSSFEWSTDNRMLSPDRRGEWHVLTPYTNSSGVHFHHPGDDKVEQFHGEYNGLDYMLYHNLFALTHGIGMPFYDYMDREVSGPLPFGAPTFAGSYGHEITIEGFNSVDANCVLASNADVDFRGGNEVNLGPGFHATAGCDFHAYIEPFHCATDGEYRTSSGTNDSSAEGFRNITAYVHYPKEKDAKTNNASDPFSNEVAQGQSQPSVTNNTVSLNAAYIQPNPNNGSFEIVLRSYDGADTKMTLINMLGTTVFTKQITSLSTVIDISGQSKGIYYVKLESKSGIQMLKVIYQ